MDQWKRVDVNRNDPRTILSPFGGFKASVGKILAMLSIYVAGVHLQLR